MKEREPFSHKLYMKIVKVFPRITTVGIVKDRKGVLLIKRNIEPCKGYWVLPGGVVSFNERLTEAVEREVREETGLKVKAVKFVGYYDEPKRVPGRRSIAHAFICKIIGGKIKPNFESSEIRFFKKLPKKIGFDHRKILKDAGVK
ncbi:MAG: NUDIX domain-containing protein [Candidatus Aenigmatarchaeota archaeon]